VRILTFTGKDAFMTLLNPIVTKCPHCGSLMSDYELMSYTVFHSENYSDGKSDNGIPDEKMVSICVECRRPFWRNDAILPGGDHGEASAGLPFAGDINEYLWDFEDNRQLQRIGFYKGLLDDGFHDSDEKEAYLRTRLWWAVNDLLRYRRRWMPPFRPRLILEAIRHNRMNRRLFMSYRQLMQKNLERLMFLYIKGGDADPLYLANMYREKGDFAKAAGIIAKSDSKKDVFFRLLVKRIRRRDSMVFEIK